MLSIGIGLRRRFDQKNESVVRVFAHLHTEMYTDRFHVFTYHVLTFSRRTTTFFQQITELCGQFVQTHTGNVMHGMQGTSWINNNLTNCNLYLFTTVPEGAVNISLESADNQIICLEEYFSNITTNYLRAMTVFEYTQNSLSTSTDNYGLKEHSSDKGLNKQRTATNFEPSLDSFSESEENLIAFTFRYCSET